MLSLKSVDADKLPRNKNIIWLLVLLGVLRARSHCVTNMIVGIILQKIPLLCVFGLQNFFICGGLPKSIDLQLRFSKAISTVTLFYLYSVFTTLLVNDYLRNLPSKGQPYTVHMSWGLTDVKLKI